MSGVRGRALAVGRAGSFAGRRGLLAGAGRAEGSGGGAPSTTGGALSTSGGALSTRGGAPAVIAALAEVGVGVAAAIDAEPAGDAERAG